MWERGANECRCCAEEVMLMRRTEEMLVIEDLVDYGRRVKTSLNATPVVSEN
jgi:hypothetical protein